MSDIVRFFLHKEDSSPIHGYLDLDDISAAVWNDDFNTLTVHLRGGTVVALPMHAGNAISDLLAERSTLIEDE